MLDNHFQLADCHIHMVLDGADWKRAIDAHRGAPDRDLIRSRLKAYAEAGVTYLRDGGDKWGVGAAARELAGEWGITYRTPLAPLICAGHYGGFIGERYRDLKEYAALVAERKRQGADFIKIMISGIMDFDRFGVLSEPGLEPGLIRELIHIAHAEGFAVMAHANGARTVEAAAAAGADSIEHGAYLDDEALRVMKENGTVWCPTLSAIGNLRGTTLSAIGNLRGTGRFDEGAVSAIYESSAENLRRFVKMDGLIVPGSDAGAWAVPHVRAVTDEYAHMAYVLGKDAEKALFRGVRALRDKF